MAQKKDTLDDIATLIAQLTATERACLEHVQAGKKSKQIAREVGLKPYTVDSAIRDACAKLGTNSRFLAARLIRDAAAASSAEAETAADPNFGSQIELLSETPFPDDKQVSAGEGNGPDDPKQKGIPKTGSRDSGDGIAWIGISHPFAKYFWGDNHVSKRRRLFLLVARAAIIAIAVGGIVNGLIGLSKLIQPQ